MSSFIALLDVFIKVLFYGMYMTRLHFPVDVKNVDIL